MNENLETEKIIAMAKLVREAQLVRDRLLAERMRLEREVAELRAKLAAVRGH